jgi:hypothetical protein
MPIASRTSSRTSGSACVFRVEGCVCISAAAGLSCAGEAVAQKRRLPGSKGFDFFVESSFVELYNETCRDLYSKSGPAGAPNLPVREL